MPGNSAVGGTALIWAEAFDFLQNDSASEKMCKY